MRIALKHRQNIVAKYNALQEDLRNIADTGKMGELSLSDYRAVCSCGKELLIHHAIKTICKNVADYFKKFGFLVTMDFDNVHYVIAEV